MSTRNEKGATLALVAASVVIIILVGVGLFFLMQIFGGFRELQHAADAGNLNVAKQALRVPNYTLDGDQAKEFQGLIDPQVRAMDLLTYDRCYGQALLVAINAASDRGTDNKPSPLGLTNAEEVAKVCHTGTNGSPGVGKRLAEALSSKSGQDLIGKFENMANRNSTRMHGSNGQLDHKEADYATAYMEIGGPTNVFIDPAILPFIGQSLNKATLPNGALSSMTKSPGINYLAGYRKLPFSNAAGAKYDLVGVPVFPQKQPHLVSGRDFTAAASNFNTFKDLVPPNAFKSVVKASVQQSNKTAESGRAESYAIVGVLDNDFPVSIPRGYIEIVNPTGIGGTKQRPPNDVYNKELMTGIHLATTKTGNTAFSTDKKLLEDWVNYNNKPEAEKTQAEYDQLVDRSYDKDNNPKINFNPKSANDFESITAMGKNGQTACFWDNVNGTHQNNTCKGLEPSFNEAYPPGNAGDGADPGSYTALEKLKEKVVNQYNAHSWEEGKCGTVNCPAKDSDYPGFTGLRYWDASGKKGKAARKQNLPSAPGANFKISRAGTLNEMLSMFETTTTAGAPALVKRQLIQRMKEIDPSLTDAQANAVFNNSPALELGTTHYLYKDGNSWKFSNSEPPARQLTNQLAADGSLQAWTVSYPTVMTMVDSLHEQGIHERYFTQATGQTNSIDSMELQLHSGRGNLLGRLTFKNFCGSSLPEQAGNKGSYYCAPD